MMEIQDLILEWNIDHSFQDGYIQTGSFPLSLAGDTFVKNRRKNKDHLIFILENFPKKIIITIPREKYPGELRSISEKSKDSEILEPLINKYNLNGNKPIGFHTLYRVLLNIVKDSDRKKVLIREGIKLELYSTSKKNIFVLRTIDNHYNTWRK